jgi:hypothetical protein
MNATLPSGHHSRVRDAASQERDVKISVTPQPCTALLLAQTRRFISYNRHPIVPQTNRTSPSHKISSMTRPPQRLQPPIIIRQRRDKSRKHRQPRHSPETRVRKTHRTVYQTQRDQILSQLHRQHRHQTHAARRPRGGNPC